MPAIGHVLNVTRQKAGKQLDSVFPCVKLSSMASKGVPVNTKLMIKERHRRGWTVRDVEDRSKELDVKFSFSSYARWESGKGRPYPRAIPAIAKVLGLDVDDLLQSERAA